MWLYQVQMMNLTQSIVSSTMNEIRPSLVGT